MTFQHDFRKKRILVTGAGGFIGSHLTEALVNLSAEVRAFVHYNSRNDWGFLEELFIGGACGAGLLAHELVEDGLLGWGGVELSTDGGLHWGVHRLVGDLWVIVF